MDHGQLELPGIGQCTSIMTQMTTTNRIDKIQVSQYLFRTSSVVDCASRSFARIEVIHVFHEGGNLGFHCSAELPTGLGIRMNRKLGHGPG